MMAPRTACLTAVIILAGVLLTLSAHAAGPVFVSPQDGAKLRGEVVFQAQKAELDGNQFGYIAYRIVPEGTNPDSVPFITAEVFPFEFTWNTQETYLNVADAWDVHNGARLYPDGEYTITAAAFDSNGKPLGELSNVTVIVANNVSNPPVSNSGYMLLRAGGKMGKELRYKAIGSLLAELSPEDMAGLTDASVPPRVEMYMEAGWRVSTRKPVGPAHTADGKRWHSQLEDAPVKVSSDGRPTLVDWRALAYGVQDEHIEYGWVEMLGGTSREQWEQWRQADLHLTGITNTILDLPGVSGGGSAGGGMMGAGMMGGGAGGPGGMMGAGGPGGMMGAGGGMMGGAGAGAGASGAGASRSSLNAPVNFMGLGNKFRSVVLPDNHITKIEMNDPRWPLAELWTSLPGQPVKIGDTWTGSMTLLPFFDQEHHMVTGGGGASTGANHLQPLYNRYYAGVGPDSINEGYGPGFGAPVHVLDGFEYYKGYECARIISRFRNYNSPNDWTREHKTGWWLSDLNPRMFGVGLGGSGSADATPIVQTDLTRVTYFAYRSGHVVGMEDHYQNRLWTNKTGFVTLAGNRNPQPQRPNQALASALTTAGLKGPGGGAAAAAPAGGGMMGGPGGMMGGPGGMMSGPGGGMMGGMGGPGGPGMMGGPGGGMMGGMGGGATATAGGGWEVGKRLGLFDAPAGGAAAGATGAGDGMMGGPGGGMMGGPGGGMMGGMGGGMMGGMGGGMMGGTGGAGATAENMATVNAYVKLQINEMGGSDALNGRSKDSIASFDIDGGIVVPSMYK